MGLIAAEVIQFENVLSEETATILSNALNHLLVEKDLSDPFFTPEEWERYKKLEKRFLINLVTKDIVFQVKKVPKR